MSKNKKLWSSMVSVAMVASTIAMPTANVMAASTNFNYAEAMQKGIMFYEFQKSGKLPENQRNNWRGDSCLDDGKDNGLDLTGGWFDAGDNVKFNLPMSYTSTILAWSYLEDEDLYKASGEDVHILDEIKWANDYFIKCNPDPDTYYFQVGDGDADHTFWGSAEIVQMERPSFKVNMSQPGSAVAGETAASLAACSIIFKDSDPAYAEKCLTHAKQLYALAEAMNSDTYYDSIARNFYKSWSGFQDELAWAGAWLYKATGEEKYLAKAEAAAAKFGPEDQGGTEVAYSYASSWDDVHLNAALLLTQITGKDTYRTNIENHLDYWATDHNGKHVTRSPKGEAWNSEWGSLRYAANTSLLACIYADWEGCSPQKAKEYKAFAKSQADYMLGSSGHSFVVGFGENAPARPHHRTAHGCWDNNMTADPQQHRHTLVGALVGGPVAPNDAYEDVITDFHANEVACDYNASFVGLMTKMYKDYGGTLIENLNAMEEVGEEIFLEAGINAQDNQNRENFIEFKFMLRNHTAWPARVTDKLKYRIFLDLSDVIANGYTADQMTVKSNYMQYSGTKLSKVLPLDEENNIYYVDVDLTGANIYPGGQTESRNEVQLRIGAPCKWDYTKSYSYKGLKGSSSSNMVRATNIAVYDDGELVFGTEPGKVQVAHTPEVSLTAPTDKAVYDFSDGNIGTIALKADATVEESTIKSVTFYVNGKAYKTVEGGNAEAEFTVPEFSTAKNGIEKYTVKAVAVAENGKKAESKTATITVKLPVKEAPVVVITAPEAGNVIDLSKESQAITVKADATVKGSTINEVEFFVNGESIGKATAGNYAASFTPSGYADKAGVPTEYVLTATATAANGTKSTSEAVKIKVQLPEKPAPVVEVITPEANEVFAKETTTVQVVAKADIAEGKVSKVIFYADGEAFATVNKAVDGVYAATYTVEGTVPEMGMLTPVVFTAEAVSDLGAKTTSDAVTVEIQKPVKVAPVVNFNIDVTNNSNGNVNSNTITNNFIINHLGGDDIDLSKLAIRYFFTKDGATSQTVWCDNAAAQMNFAPWYVAYTGKVKGSVVPMATPTADADSYIEIVFNGSDTIKAGAQLTIATRTSKSDWSNYDQSNDFSYGDSNKVAVYYDGELIAGMEP